LGILGKAIIDHWPLYFFLIVELSIGDLGMGPVTMGSQRATGLLRGAFDET
jgi:hypothetical protein